MELNQKEEALITFHGGEPLMASKEFYYSFVNQLLKTYSGVTYSFSIQTNLWNLDLEYIDFFFQHKFDVSTSIDGPKDICDSNRGSGYWEKTMKGISLCKDNQISISAIATLTGKHTDRIIDIAEFFLANNLNFSIRPVAGRINKPTVENQSHNINSFVKAYINLFDWYLDKRKYIRIPTFDAYVKALIQGKSDTCLFTDCSDLFTVIDPQGFLYSCQRFCGHREYSWGNITEKPEQMLSKKSNSSYRSIFNNYMTKQNQNCLGCDFITYCNGGCFYNALSSKSVKDPYCFLYKELFSTIQTRLLEEMISNENKHVMQSKPTSKPGSNTFFRKGRCISLADEIHPSVKAANARLILTLFELSKTSNSQECMNNLYEKKVLNNTLDTFKRIEDLQLLVKNKTESLTKLYIHITSKCNLKCSHCYNQSTMVGEDWNLVFLRNLLEQAKDCGFRIITINGGEPLLHKDFITLLEICRDFRGGDAKITLSSNLSIEISDELMRQISDSFDEVKVSVDGTETMHNELRNHYCYKTTINNIERLVALKASYPSHAKISITCVVRDLSNTSQIMEMDRFAAYYKVDKLSIRPILPIGYAANMGLLFKDTINDVDESILESNEFPKISCGIVDSINIRIDGSAYPCFATYKDEFFLGNIFTDGLDSIIRSQRCKNLNCLNMNNNIICRDCEYKYLCGGVCQAWIDVTYPTPGEYEALFCRYLKPRLRKIVNIAVDYVSK